MNIFIMVLVFIFMAGYYFIDSPSQNIAGHNLEQALEKSYLHSIAECTAEAHNDALQGLSPDMECVKKYNISSENYCINERNMVDDCNSITDDNRASTGFMITKSDKILIADTNGIIETIEKWYPNISNFGLIAAAGTELFIMSSGGVGEIPASVARAAELSPGQLAYITQYSIRPAIAVADINATKDIICAANQLKVFRFNRWECADKNTARACAGDTIWDYDTESCVADEQSRPICRTGQNAVLVEDNWECVNPVAERECPTGMMPRLDYSSMEWVCVSDPLQTGNATKCTPQNEIRDRIVGAGGQVIRTVVSRCTDCEVMITDPNTCDTACVPDAAQLDNPACYAKPKECSGGNRAFYFGFPDSRDYQVNAVLNIPELENVQIAMGMMHSRNRKFNCLDCGEKHIDRGKSLHPFVASCE